MNITMSNHPQSKLPIQKIIQDVLDYTSMKVPRFSEECGFKGGTRIYAVFNENRALGLDSYHSIINRFPELNGDRFVRKSGPLLLSDLCDSVLTKTKDDATIKTEVVETLDSTPVGMITDKEYYYKAIIQGKENEIMRQEKEIDFLRGLLIKQHQ